MSKRARRFFPDPEGDRHTGPIRPASSGARNTVRRRQLANAPVVPSPAPVAPPEVADGQQGEMRIVDRTRFGIFVSTLAVMGGLTIYGTDKLCSGSCSGPDKDRFLTGSQITRENLIKVMPSLARNRRRLEAILKYSQRFPGAIVDTNTVTAMSGGQLASGKIGGMAGVSFGYNQGDKLEAPESECMQRKDRGIKKADMVLMETVRKAFDDFIDDVQKKLGICLKMRSMMRSNVDKDSSWFTIKGDQWSLHRIGQAIDLSSKGAAKHYTEIMQIAMEHGLYPVETGDCWHLEMYYGGHSPALKCVAKINAQWCLAHPFTMQTVARYILGTQTGKRWALKGCDFVDSTPISLLRALKGGKRRGRD